MGVEAKTALVMGAGGLGTPAALALAAAGTRRLVVADATPLTATDLPLLPLLAGGDVGRPRAELLARAMARLAPELVVEAVETPLDAAAALGLARQAAVVIDATDRFPEMFLTNDAAAAAGVPLVHGGLLHHTAQLLTVMPGQTGCLRCLFEGPPTVAPAIVEPGVLGPLAGLAGALLGAEAARLLDGAPPAYAGRLVSWEARSGWTRGVAVPPRPGCSACGGRAPLRAPATARALTGTEAP